MLSIEPSLIVKAYNPLIIGVHVNMGRLLVGARLYTIDKQVSLSVV
jgi:hypothetical protein